MGLTPTAVVVCARASLGAAVSAKERGLQVQAREAKRFAASTSALHCSTFDLPQAQELVIDFALHLPRANGKHSVKVFKWKIIKIIQKTSF